MTSFEEYNLEAQFSALEPFDFEISGPENDMTTDSDFVNWIEVLLDDTSSTNHQRSSAKLRWLPSTRINVKLVRDDKPVLNTVFDAEQIVGGDLHVVDEDGEEIKNMTFGNILRNYYICFQGTMFCVDETRNRPEARGITVTTTPDDLEFQTLVRAEVVVESMVCAKVVESIPVVSIASYQTGHQYIRAKHVPDVESPKGGGRNRKRKGTRNIVERRTRFKGNNAMQ
eukprot:CAMPEP_0116136598 /NCGR_PEP_ID=MMETSP0329-20121206/11810_1 /TAXON_ID=697910 /ORGANISM="Pseudo-nitzschia arenysensis, Strain B593" /LENGTH=226 /DNA_ID=CAMNT_0003631477 /DNA_START=16 /DNA_END=696 /DNA_ORIENTATION=-